MKNRLIQLLVLFLTIGLVSCSTNTQQQNEGIGAVSGAVIGGVAGSFIGQGTGQVVAIGAGAIIGALVGYEIGKNMDSADSNKTYNALNNNPTNKASHWKNKKTGARYTVVPTSNHMAMGHYNNCRTYRTTAVINGQSQTVNGTACRQANGTWKAMNS